ncbi:MAG: DUF4399 domain-containing protein [Nitrospinales bacterium]
MTGKWILKHCKLTYPGFIFLLGLIFFLGKYSFAVEQERKVIIIEPDNGAVLSNPIKVCMLAEGLVLEPADLGVREGHGHHHIVFSSLPLDLSKPLKRKEAIHLDEAQSCVKLKLEPGNHVIIALFSYADHVPYDPPIMDKILIKIK